MQILNFISLNILFTEKMEEQVDTMKHFLLIYESERDLLRSSYRKLFFGGNAIMIVGRRKFDREMKNGNEERLEAHERDFYLARIRDRDSLLKQKLSTLSRPG